MKIAIWTKNTAKLNAVSLWIEKCIYFDNPENIEIIPESVDSEVSDMPISLEENIAWAMNRAKNLIKKWIKAEYYIGMEWGTSIVWEKSYLLGVVYIINSKWEEHFWITNWLEVPKEIHRRLYGNWEELWPIQDELSWEKNTSHKNGSYGVWTDNMITRSDSFIHAFLCAITPFYNKYYKL